MRLEEPKLKSDLAYETLILSGDDWADKDAAANLLEETRKSLLAELQLGVEAKSEAAKEKVALASDAYRKHIASMVEARKQANRARVRYDSAKVLAEMRRSEESTRRAEMTLR